ncbi:MAG: hypothetical protein ACRDTF_13865 [Pseudonocardiaceae bacterium]
MLIEPITSGVVAGFVRAITEQFIKRRKASIEIGELRELMLAIHTTHGEIHERIVVVEQLARKLADHEPFAISGGTLMIQPGVQGTTVENALDQFASSVLAKIRDERENRERADQQGGERQGGQGRGKATEPSDGDPLREVLSGFHEKLRHQRQQPPTGDQRE